MSRKFMVLMLAVFGVLLYLTSFALRKQEEPPPAPSADVMAGAKERQEKDYKERMKQMQKEHPQMANYDVTKGKIKPGAKPVGKKLGNTDAPVSAPPKSTVRKPNEMTITSDWIHHHSDGPQGIEQEIKEREKHAAPAPEKAKPILDPGTPAPIK